MGVTTIGGSVWIDGRAGSTPPPAAEHASPVSDRRLDSIRERVALGQRLSMDDGMVLMTTPDVWGVCELADGVRRRLHGGRAFYNINRHLNYSNVCALSCKFCEFYRKRDEPGAYTRSLDEVRQQARAAVDAGATEMHIVGGLNPYLPFGYYTDMLSAIRHEAPRLHLKAFTAVEVVHLARIAKVYRGEDRVAGIRWVLTALMKAGLDSLPGGGAEVFDDRVHDEAFKGKIRSDVWLDVHRVAHELGLNSNATLLYGHIESPRDRLVHMEMLRRAQDRALARLGYQGSAHQGLGKEAASGRESGHLGYAGDEGHDVPEVTLTRAGVPLPEHVAFHDAERPAAAAGTNGAGSLPRPTLASGYFQTIIPLPFFPDGSELERLPGPTGIENLRTLAVARLMLDNFAHVKAFWIMQTIPMAQLMLQSGADDIDGTVVWYDITKVGGVGTHQEVRVTDLHKAIRDAGFEPIERDSLYRRVERRGREWSVVASH